MEWKRWNGRLCILVLCALFPLLLSRCKTSATRTVERELKKTEVIYFRDGIMPYPYDPTKHLKDYYAVTDSKEISRLIGCLKLKNTKGFLWGYSTEAIATNQIIFMKDNETYLNGDFIDPTLRFSGMGEFEISEAAAELIRGYLEKAKQSERKE